MAHFEIDSFDGLEVNEEHNNIEIMTMDGQYRLPTGGWAMRGLCMIATVPCSSTDFRLRLSQREAERLHAIIAVYLECWDSGEDAPDAAVSDLSISGMDIAQRDES